MKKLLVLWFATFGFLISCDTSFFEIAHEPAKDPEIALPRVESFMDITGIPVSWDKDPLATGYVLWRQLSSSSTAIEVYRGKNTNFVDTTATQQTMYLYSLAKIRGKKEFPKSAPIPGLYDSFNTVTPANGKTPAQAVALTNIVNGIVFYSQNSTIGPDIQTFTYTSSDWYYYDLPPGMMAQFKLNYVIADPKAYLYFNHGSDKAVFDGGLEQISNPSFATQRMYFSIRYNTSAGAALPFFKLEYKITLNNLTLISP